MTSAMDTHEWKELCDRYNRYGGEMFIFFMVNNVDHEEFAMWHKKLSQPSKQFIPVELQREDAMPLATIDLPQGIKVQIHSIDAMMEQPLYPSQNQKTHSPHYRQTGALLR